MLALLSGLLIGLVVSIVFPYRYGLFLLGFFLPIDVFLNIDPFLLDTFRYTLAIVLILRMRYIQKSTSSKVNTLALLSLLAVSLIGFTKSVYSNDGAGIYSSAIGMASVSLAFMLTKYPYRHKPILLGFVFGTTASAIDIILQFAGLPFFGTVSTFGVRYAGLSFSSTNTAPYLALSLVLVISPWLWNLSTKKFSSTSFTRLVLGALILIGLLISGGRGGLAGFLVALIFGATVALLRKPLAFIIFACLAPIGIMLYAENLFSFFNRDPGGDITTGRAALNSEAWNSFLKSSFFGVDNDLTQMLRPHSALLSFSITAGVMGLIFAITLTIILCIVILRSARQRLNITFGMMAAIMLVTAMLEPIGFYVGLAKTTLLMIVLFQYQTSFDLSKTDPNISSQLLTNGSSETTAKIY